ncbi:NAD(P)-dependent oxidoreductase [Loigolactobacillus binensis]|uniref:NAD(P)-dependent oxidoreductase n=1 Tax=Loigolactobacillus binensis TaxID=2559922 RepID=A0ABW3EBQ7_9LACO|nr:NAD(P)-dependent oxidoreductase [Loigolactobacillus binensis]
MNILTATNFSAAQISQLESLPDVHVIRQNNFQPKMAPTIDVIMAWSPLAAKILAGPNRVKFIQTSSAGIDYLPLAALVQQKVLVAHAGGIHGDAIAQSVLGYILDFARYITHPQNRDPQNFWQGRIHRRVLYSVVKKRVLIYGTGHVGQAISQLLQQVGLSTIGVNHNGHAAPAFVETVALAASNAQPPVADFIVNTLPLTSATQHFFNADFFARQPQPPIFINVGRGPSVDTAALITALENGQLAGAALDVFEQEPLPADSPLWQAPNLIMTPHTTGTVDNVEDVLFAIFYPNLQSFCRTGKLSVNQADLKLGY